MLLELRIRNLAVIDTVTLPLATGLNVLTGETGAGKSLIVGALTFLLGERAASDRVREGAEKASVEGVFDVVDNTALRALLDERGIEVDESLVILRREVSRTGRSRAWINGTSVTAAMLSDVGAHLVSVHGQHESRQLLDAEMQRELLDAYAGASDTAAVVRQHYATVRDIDSRVRHLEQQQREAAQQVDYLRFVASEIDAAQLEPGEIERLDVEIQRLSHAEELQANAQQAIDVLAGEEASALTSLSIVRRALQSLTRIDREAARYESQLEESIVSLGELVRDVEHYASGIESDPERLRVVEARRAEVRGLLRKYGPTVEDALATAARAREQLALATDDAGDLDTLATRRDAAMKELQQAAGALTKLRRKGAVRLADEVTALLPELGMPQGRFEVLLDKVAEVGAHGAESARFNATLNAGAEMRPLGRIASGGELSRLMLALSTVLARLQQVNTLVFDEVDAGIGGEVAWQVGALMQRVAAHHQVLAISHLAQIAVFAHHHVVVHKEAGGVVTTADTTVVSGDARTLEIARMLGGDADRAVSRAHARELLERGAALSGVR